MSWRTSQFFPSWPLCFFKAAVVLFRVEVAQPLTGKSVERVAGDRLVSVGPVRSCHRHAADRLQALEIARARAGSLSYSHTPTVLSSARKDS